MPKVQIQYTDLFALTMQRLREDGLLLASQGSGRQAQCNDDWLGNDRERLVSPRIHRAGAALPAQL